MQRARGIELRSILGVGGFGKVYLAYDTHKRCECAVKLIHKKLVEQDQLHEYLEREIDIMQRLHHRHVIALIDSFRHGSYYWLVMELAQGGELFDKIVQSKRFSEAMARHNFQQLVSAVAYCHARGVVHRDLKAENLLLDSHGSLKVCDFGLSRYAFQPQLADGLVLFTSQAGSTDYQSPEMISDEGYTGFASDIWSMGVILFFMLCGYLPFAAHTEAETKERIFSCRYNTQDPFLSRDAVELIHQLLTINPQKRIKLEGIIQHRWFRKGLDLNEFPEFVQERKREQNTAGESKDAIRNVFQRLSENSTQLQRAQLVAAVIPPNTSEERVTKLEEALTQCFFGESTTDVSEQTFVESWPSFSVQTGLRLSHLSSVVVATAPLALSPHQVTVLHRAFDRLDKEHNGELTLEDILAIPELDFSEQDALELLKAIDQSTRIPSDSTSASFAKTTEPTSLEPCRSVCFDAFARACVEQDLLKMHSVGAKLQRLEDLFEAASATRGTFSSYIHTGFTVTGEPSDVYESFLKKGSQSPLYTLFEPEDGELNLQGTLLRGTMSYPSTNTTPVSTPSPPSSSKPNNPQFPLHSSPVRAQQQHHPLQVCIRFRPAASGYTKVFPYRIAGRTKDFHLWFGLVRKFLQREIVQCQEDTAISGPSILL